MAFWELCGLCVWEEMVENGWACRVLEQWLCRAGQFGALGLVSGTCICQWNLVCFVSQLMRNLLGTHLGHSAIYNMCRIMEDR